MSTRTSDHYMFVETAAATASGLMFIVTKKATIKTTAITAVVTATTKKIGGTVL